ncbi:nuclear transport factor 2 family protein [Halomonas sp. WWR20]
MNGKVVGDMYSAAQHSERELSDAEQRNKDIVMDYYDLMMYRETPDFEGAEKYWDDHYIQHDALIPQGREAIKQFTRELYEKYPERWTQTKRVWVDGNFVIMHLHVIEEPGTPGLSMIDIFRVEKDKVVEHWDVFQAIPVDAINDPF